MKKNEVLGLDAGRGIDLLVAQKIMINHTRHGREIPRYSTNAYFAQEVAERIREKYPLILHGSMLWECKVFLPTGHVISSGRTDLFPLAICKAALLTVIEEESQIDTKELRLMQKFNQFFSWKPKHNSQKEKMV